MWLRGAMPWWGISISEEPAAGALPSSTYCVHGTDIHTWTETDLGQRLGDGGGWMEELIQNTRMATLASWYLELRWVGVTT
jgi:hypothetical protein